MADRFECDCCGLCCRNIRLSNLYSDLDRGDGVCKHYDEETRLCGIYASRPLKCNVDEYYDRYLSSKMSRAEFHEMNHAVCRQLKSLASKQYN